MPEQCDAIKGNKQQICVNKFIGDRHRLAVRRRFQFVTIIEWKENIFIERVGSILVNLNEKKFFGSLRQWKLCFGKKEKFREHFVLWRNFTCTHSWWRWWWHGWLLAIDVHCECACVCESAFYCVEHWALICLFIIRKWMDEHNARDLRRNNVQNGKCITNCSWVSIVVRW